jgi:4-diphosphocytidyl-2-C-methyl-D-erythritol kinase|tara:strand:- start:77 stop:940 length:864 start_codon:yes stop_codon:yes gene_type:complete
MKAFLIQSFCKINLSLRVINRLKTGLHKIQSLITFANLFDKISVQETNSTKDRIKFSGKFKYSISSQKNSIKKTMDILREYNYLKNKKFIINVKKNIPHSAGLGGGSMNSATLINFFLSTYKLNISQKKLLTIAYKIGSDVPLGLKIKNTFLISSNKYLVRTKSKLNLYVLLVNPGIKCLSKNIYFRNRRFSKSYPKKIFSNFYKLFDLKKIKLDRNDLEQVVFKIYPKIKTLNDFIKEQENCIFSRMTGSGSTCVGYFNKLTSAKKAKKNIQRKFPSYWCVTAKTI